MSESSSQALLTFENLRQFTEEQRREDAHQRGFPTPSPEPIQQSSRQSPKSTSVTRWARRVARATDSERARMFASKMPERKQQEETFEGSRSVDEVANGSQHTSQPEPGVINHPVVTQIESTPIEDLQEREKTTERDRSDNEINNGSQNTSQPEVGLIGHSDVLRNGSARATTDFPQLLDESSNVRQPEKPKVVLEPMPAKIQQSDHPISRIHREVCEVIYPGRKLSSLTSDEGADLRNIAEAVYPTWRKELDNIMAQECNEVAQIVYPGRTPQFLDVIERAKVKKEWRDYKAHMKSIGGPEFLSQGKMRLRELIHYKQKGQVPDAYKYNGEFRHSYMESVTRRHFGGQMAGVLTPTGNMAGPTPVEEPLQHTHNDIANSFLFLPKDDALLKNHTVEKPLKKQPSEEFCSRLSDLFPPDFPRFQVAQNLNDISAYLANASYVISLGGAPVPDLKYGIIAVPLGEEKLLFDNSSQRDTMTPELLQAVRDAQYFSRGDGSLHPIDSGERKIYLRQYPVNTESESESEADIYNTNWVSAIDPGARTKASGGTKRKRSDDPTADSGPDSQAVAILSGPVRGQKIPDADTGGVSTEIPGVAGDNVFAVAKQIRQSTRLKTASRQPTIKTGKNVQTRASALKKEVPPPKRMASAPKKATTTRATRKAKPG